MAFDDAEQVCADLGGHLTSIHSQAEGDFVDAEPSVVSAFIGATDAALEGTFVWTDCTPFDFANWLTDEPNDFMGEDCVEVPSVDPTDPSIIGWNDVPCGSAPFVCKVP